MDHVIVEGNYLDPDGRPVIATQLPTADAPNVIGGAAAAAAWVCRWIKACADVTLFAHEDGGVQWDHGRTRHVLRPGEWIVWTGHEYRVVPNADFTGYAPVNLLAPTPPDENPATTENGDRA